ncbi:1-deoxy-D-xylulose-5-phosphate synthase [SAR86 cluster bacterium]|nr:1-deoxy-D-xylulose-5-phosphate synthase [SAR86 cluster bacterium]
MFDSIPDKCPDTPLLDRVNSPSDLKQLKENQLGDFCDELREFLLYTVGQTGGHFGAGLGVVELTVALHYVFDSPKDKIVWDVGHQTYPHKIITGRKSLMSSMRQKNGLHPFPSREESIFDTFGVGHSSTSISAALGMTVGSNEKAIAVIGDGALTAGMAFEALSHSGNLNKDLLVILNDNNMSISKNIGGLSNYLARIWSSRWYTQIREGGKMALRLIPSARNFASKAEEHIKGMVAPGTLFEELGFNYVGPMDGHNVKEIIRTLRNLNDTSGPKLLHLITKKGKGFKPAEDDPIGFHAITKMENPNSSKKKNVGMKYSDVFGSWLTSKANVDTSLVAITPAMKEGSGMVEFADKFPSRFYDVAIAEQHAMTFAAGLACEGKKPVLAIYSTFLQRAYDQLIHDVAIQNLDLLIAIDRAGLVGEDGATHSGIFDLSFMRCIPNLIVMTPSSEAECWRLLETGYNFEGPAAVRYPKGFGLGTDLPNEFEEIEIGKAKEIKFSESNKISILNFGSMLSLSDEISKDLDANLIDMRFVKPLDTECIIKCANHSDLLVTLEDNVVAGGAGSAINEFIAEEDIKVKAINFGISDDFPSIGGISEQREDYQLDRDKIVRKIKEKLSK